MRLSYDPRRATWSVLLCGSPVLFDGREAFRSFFEALKVLTACGLQIGPHGEIY